MDEWQVLLYERMKVMRVGTFFRSKSNSFFYNLFIKIYVLVAIVVIILSAILYVYFESNLLTVTKSSNEQKLAQIQYSTEHTNNDINKFITTLFNSEDINLLMYLENPTQLKIFDEIKKINSFISSTPYAYSLHILNLQRRSYYTAGPFFASSKDFFDPEIIKAVLNMNGYKSPTYLTRKMPVSGLDNTGFVNVISYIICEKSFISGQPVSALVLNIKADWLFDVINSMNTSYSESKGSIFIIDHQGMVIAHPDKNMFMKDLSSDEYISSIINKGGKGSFTTGKGIDKKLITYSYCAPLDWYIVSSIPYHFITEAINTYRLFSIFICVFILLSGILFSLFISRTLYTPLDNLGKTIKKLIGDKSLIHKESNEFTYVSNAFENVMSSLGELQDFKTNNMSLLKKNRLKELLSGNYSELKHIFEAFDEKNSNFDLKGCVCLIIFKIDNYENFCEKFNLGDRNLMLFAIQNVACELISGCFKCESTDIGGDHSVIFINIPEGDTEKVWMDKLYPLIKEIQANVYKYLGISISAGASRLSGNINEISDNYHLALDKLDNRFKLGHMCIIQPESFDDINNGHFELPINKIKGLVNALKLSRPQQLMDIYDNIINLISGFTCNDIRFCLTYLFDYIYEALTVMESNGSDILEIDSTDFTRKINSLETLAQINEEFCNLFQKISIKKQGENKTEKLITVIINIINSKYSDYNLCTDYIANQIKISPIYLRKIFKEATSMSVSEYINDIRLNKAKELLKKSSMNVEEIIDKIGWENKKYFFIIFKKNFGVTPSQFRLSKVNLI